MEEVWQFLEWGGTVTITSGFPRQALQLSLAAKLSVTFLSSHKLLCAQPGLWGNSRIKVFRVARGIQVVFICPSLLVAQGR